MLKDKNFMVALVLVVAMLLIMAPFMADDAKFKYCTSGSGKIEDQSDGAKGLSMAGVALVGLTVVWFVMCAWKKPAYSVGSSNFGYSY